MKTLNKISYKTSTLISLICLLIPVSIYILWIYAAGLGTTQTERVIIFKSYFPDFLSGRWSTTILSIFFCIVAIIISSNSLKLSKNFWKATSTTILIISSLLLFLNLFSMM
jgi:hypothetical protein